MFIDIAKIKIVSGKGGDGKVGFHREKYVAAGGPDGGDGGRGGSVIFKVDDNLSTLLDFRYKKKYVAAPGEPGGGKRCKGKDGADLVIRVPRGTIIRDQKTGQVMKDMSDNEPYVAAKGGNGGWGNTHFATPTRQAPRGRRSGRLPERRQVHAAEHGIGSPSEDRELPLHDPRAQSGRGLRGRGAELRHGGHPGHHRGRERGRRPRS